MNKTERRNIEKLGYDLLTSIRGGADEFGVKEQMREQNEQRMKCILNLAPADADAREQYLEQQRREALAPSQSSNDMISHAYILTGLDADNHNFLFELGSIKYKYERYAGEDKIEELVSKWWWQVGCICEMIKNELRRIAPIDWKGMTGELTKYMTAEKSVIRYVLEKKSLPDRAVKIHWKGTARDAAAFCALWDFTEAIYNRCFEGIKLDRGEKSRIGKVLNNPALAGFDYQRYADRTDELVKIYDTYIKK